MNRLREKDYAAALAAVDAAEEARPVRPGKANDEPFDDFRDCDDVLASVIELYVGTDYFWIPLQQVNSLEFTKPQNPRDLLWTACTIELADGNVQRGFCPVLYHGTHQHEDPQVRLGRMTDWKETDDGPVLGVGQRMFIAGEDAKAMLDVRTLEFHLTE